MTTLVKEVSTFFVQNEEQNDIIDSLREYSANEKRQVYIIRSPLGNNDFEYDYEKGMMLLIPDFKIIFLNEDSEDSENFTYYINDVLNDIDNISLYFKFPTLFDNNLSKFISNTYTASLHIVGCSLSIIPTVSAFTDISAVCPGWNSAGIFFGSMKLYLFSYPK